MNPIKDALKFIHLWFVSTAEYDSVWLLPNRPIIILVVKSITLEYYPKVAYKVESDLIRDPFIITELELLRNYEKLHV